MKAKSESSRWGRPPRPRPGLTGGLTPAFPTIHPSIQHPSQPPLAVRERTNEPQASHRRRLFPDPCPLRPQPVAPSRRRLVAQPPAMRESDELGRQQRGHDEPRPAMTTASNPVHKVLRPCSALCPFLLAPGSDIRRDGSRSLLAGRHLVRLTDTMYDDARN